METLIQRIHKVRDSLTWTDKKRLKESGRKLYTIDRGFAGQVHYGNECRSFRTIVNDMERQNLWDFEVFKNVDGGVTIATKDKN